MSFFATQMVARLGDVKSIRALPEEIATSSWHYSSMLTSHYPDGLHNNLDIGLSYPRVLKEMLIFSHHGNIYLAWANGKQTSAVFYAGRAGSLQIST